ncbi:phosphate starvation protein PhoH [Sporomusaceae bacterium FL31]|nr:phosphate starvation protein PhoH [Sporomusaceae bacterium FL31]
MQQETENRVLFANSQEALAILGRNDEHLNIVCSAFSAKVICRGEELVISGLPDEVVKLTKLFTELLFLYRQGNPVTAHDIRYSIRLLQEGYGEDIHKMFGETVLVTARGRHIKPKTLGQREYLEAIRNNYITLGIGPAGTGKTYLAVAMAVFSLKKKEVERIILTRPAVEAGEKLGFLPGDLQEKVDPYLRPLYDALYDILGADTVQKYMAKNIIEVAPLAYMRGRTLDDAFIILDEAQNTTPPQMKMFLTRFGFGSKMVVTGDLSQTDLAPGVLSGLRQAQQILIGVPGIECITLSANDVIRHEIVGRIIKAYDRHEQTKN